MLLGLRELTALALADEKKKYDAVDRMRIALDGEKDVEIRHLAAECLSQLLGGSTTTNPVVTLCYQLEHEEWRLIKSCSVLEAIGALHDPQAVDTLLRQEPGDRDNRHSLYVALSQIPDHRCVKRLISYLKAGDYYNESCLKAVEAALSNYPAKVDEADLRELAAIDGVKVNVQYPSGPSVDKPLDLSTVRNLAQTELSRRGI
jgi:hypothetical protein